jgi:hypothetical protein
MSRRPHACEPVAGPSGSGTVVLELGPGAGALVLYTPAGQDGAEIEVSLAGCGGRRTHSMVRPRHLAGATVHAAVYPDLAPGEYTIWDGAAAVATTRVAAGAVTTATWPGS